MNTAMNDHIAQFVKGAHILVASAVIALLAATVPAGFAFSNHTSSPAKNRTRDAALRSFAETFLGEKSPGLHAQEILSASTRYGASVWRVDQDNEEMLARYAGTPKECLWRAFKSGAQMPIGE
jgi:predicted metal-dependent hydrolase